MTRVRCTGTETLLDQCELDSFDETTDTCEHHAGVICRGIYVYMCWIEDLRIHVSLLSYDIQIRRITILVFFFQGLDTKRSNCSDGDLQLVGGVNPREGRVEVCFSQAWGSICPNSFGGDDAAVICRQLNQTLGNLGPGTLHIMSVNVKSKLLSIPLVPLTLILQEVSQLSRLNLVWEKAQCFWMS